MCGMEPEVSGLLSQFSAIKRFAQTPSSSEDIEVVRNLIAEYEEARNQFDKLKDEMKLKGDLRQVFEISIRIQRKAILQSIIIQCEKAIGVLESIRTPLPKAEADRLLSIREELGKLSGRLPNIFFEKNLVEAIKEYEQQSFLASTLIAGRVVIYALDQITGNTIKEKFETLQGKGLVEKGRSDVEEAILKANKKARNFFSHNITITPTSSDALSLIGDAVKIVAYLVE